MRGVAAALQGRFLDPYPLRAWERIPLSVAALFGQRVARAAVAQGAQFLGVHPTWADRITAEQLARWATSLYEESDGPFDALVVGAPNGGVAHLAAATRAPFLSQHFLVSFRGPGDPDDIQSYFDRGTALAGRILSREPSIAVVNHYDPLHDRFLVRWVNHIRIKLLDLPQAYQDFIRRRLRPGGTLVFTDCRYSWLQYRVGPRHTFQVGGLGGVSDTEFTDGRPDVESLRGTPGGWSLPGMPVETQAESEWGAAPPLCEVVETFARAHGYGFLALRGDHPEWYSHLALRAYRRLSEREEREPAGTLLEVFTQSNPIAPLVARLLPVWLPFNCTDSLDLLREVRAALPVDRPVLFTPLSNFVHTPDTVGWGDYEAALDGLDVGVLGVRRGLFPSDPAGLWRPAEELARWCRRHPDAVGVRLGVGDLEALAAGR